MSKKSWSTMPERGSLWAIRCLVFVLSLLGYRVASALLPPIVAYFFITGRRSRRASMDYLARLNRFDSATAKPSLARSYQHHLEFARTILDRVLLWQGRLEQFRFSGSGRELLAGSEGTGVMIVGSHLGSFDLLRVLAMDFEKVVHVVMYRSNAKQINSILEALNPDANLRVIELDPGDIAGVIQLKTCVEHGDHIAILVDRHPPGPRKRVCRIPFLGDEVEFPESPWVLAELLGCPVVLATAVRTGSRKYEITVEPLTTRVIPRKESRENGSKEHVAAFARRLEDLCRAYPLQWFNFYDFWGLESSAARSVTGRSEPTDPKNQSGDCATTVR